MQTKKHSLAESIANVLVGYTVAVCSQILIFPFFDVHIPIEDNAIIGLWFTAISIGRSYALRRWFTMRTERGRHSMPMTITATVHSSQDDTEHPGFEAANVYQRLACKIAKPPSRKMEVHASWDYSFSYSGSEYICRHTLWVGAAFPHKKAEFSVYSNKCDYIAARLRMDRLNRFHLRPAYRKTLQFTCRQLRKKARHAWRMILKTIEKGGSK